MPQPDRSYLRENNAFYKDFWAENPLYSTAYPNRDEACRMGPIQKMVSRLAESGAIRPETTRILDLGCGRGWLTHALSVYGHAEGLEPTPEAIALARGLFPGTPFTTGSLADKLGEPDFVPYDLIVSSEVLEHVPHSEKSAFVGEIRQALGENGHCIITTPRQELWDRCGDSSSQMIEDWVTEKELVELFRQNGFEAIEHARAFPTNAPLARRILVRLERVFPSWTHDVRTSAVGVAIDYASCLYQVWCFETAGFRQTSVTRTG